MIGKATEDGFELAVIGDGIVGIACALELQRRGVATTMIAPSDHPRGASIGNAGHIATEQVEPLASAATIRSLPARLSFRGGPVALPLRDIAEWLPFSLRFVSAARRDRLARGTMILTQMLSTALPAWRRLAAEAGAGQLLREDGHYIVWESKATASSGRAHWERANCGEARWRAATKAEVADLQRLVNVPIEGAIRFSGSGQVTDLDTLHKALRLRFVELGGTIRHAVATRLNPNDKTTVITLADGSALRASKVVVAAGVDSRKLLEPLGMTVP
ncbi:MAG TPA: FAD-binding oxidoreductase, partial [Sphingomicrobium sp.]|nr:FAD-binding oxidoreductase [Sphingomicrobium sp.]